MKFAAVAATLAAGFASQAIAGSANPVSFNVVPNLSSISINGTVGNSPLSSQTVGSQTTTYTGTIQGDLSGNQFTIFSMSTLDANPQAVNQQPGLNGVSGSAAADYGFTVPFQPFGTGFIAARNVNLSLTSIGSLTLASSALTGTTNFTFNTADIDYNAVISSGRESLEDLSGDNAAVGATLVTVGNIQTLTIPVSVICQTSLIQSNDTTLNVAGTIVATRVVPEPTMLGLVGAAGLLMKRHRA